MRRSEDEDSSAVKKGNSFRTEKGGEEEKSESSHRGRVDSFVGPGSLQKRERSARRFLSLFVDV